MSVPAPAGTRRAGFVFAAAAPTRRRFILIHHRTDASAAPWRSGAATTANREC